MRARRCSTYADRSGLPLSSLASIRITTRPRPPSAASNPVTAAKSA